MDSCLDLENKSFNEILSDIKRPTKVGDDILRMFFLGILLEEFWGDCSDPEWVRLHRRSYPSAFTPSMEMCSSICSKGGGVLTRGESDVVWQMRKSAAAVRCAFYPIPPSPSTTNITWASAQQQLPNLIKSGTTEAAIVFYVIAPPPPNTHFSFCLICTVRAKIKAEEAPPPAAAPWAQRQDFLIKSLLLLTVRWVFNRFALLCHFSFSRWQWNFLLFCWCFLISYFPVFMAAGRRRRGEERRLVCSDHLFFLDVSR